MSDVANIRKQLRIKAGSAKRLYKEHRLYQKEEEDLKRKLDQYVADNAEEWDVKNTRRMLEESGKMITDSATRLGAVMQELRELVLAAEQEPELAQDEELMKAKETLEEVSV
ncbi:tubulin binding cofactor A [Trametes coccinea BRFM310]|uniref:Tubulin-specific chaperone A n=1 Tax=Trametes coccinea (strain BRFM310) TaxID=1353009 RepID=A0A1Y2J117_TRAC3|nr:tubulin binding cofactor A [Trametes coccinea BRFM310]